MTTFEQKILAHWGMKITTKLMPKIEGDIHTDSPICI